MKLLLDEMWPPSVAEALRSRGHDVVAVAERLGLRSASDGALFDVALVEGRVIVTEDVTGFRPLMADAVRDGRDFPSIILTSNRRWPRAQPGTAGRLVEALNDLLVADKMLEGEHWL